MKNNLALRARLRIEALVRIMLGREGHERLFDRLVRGAVWSFILKVAATGLGFVTSVILARVLGAGGYGTYAYAMALVGLLGIPGTLGLPQLVLRNVAAYQARSEWGLMRGLLRRANLAVLLAALGVGLIALTASLALRGQFNPAMLAAFLLALTILPLAALNALRGATLRGLGYVVLGQLPEALIRPLIFVSLVLSAHFLLENRFGVLWTVGIQVGATVIALGCGMLILVRRLPREMKGIPPSYESRAWARSALPFLLIGGMQIINNQTDIVMLGILRGAEAVGIYRVVTRSAQLVIFMLTAAGMVLQPTVARLYAMKDMQRLQHITTLSARVVLLVSAPIAIAMIVFGRWILLIFGQAFAVGATALAILSVGQLVSAAMGFVGLLLNMTGHEHDTAKGVGVAAVVNVALNAILIPLWGMNGAAIATATSVVVWSLILAVLVVRRIDIHSTAVGRINLGKESAKR